MSLIKRITLITAGSLLALIGLVASIAVINYVIDYKWFYFKPLPNKYVIKSHGNYDYMIDSCGNTIISEGIIGYCVYSNRYILVAHNPTDTVKNINYGDKIGDNLFFWIIDSNNHIIYGPFDSKEYYIFKNKLHIPFDRRISFEW